MYEAGFTSPLQYFAFLGGERALGVSNVYFGDWIRGKGLPRPDKLELLLRNVSAPTARLRVVQAYLRSQFHGEHCLTGCLESLLQTRCDVAPAAVARSPVRASAEITPTQLTFLASNIEHYKVFSCFLARRALELATSTERLAALVDMPPQRARDIVENLTRFELVEQRGEGAWQLVAVDIHWPKGAESKPALLLLNEYDRQLHATLERRVKNRSLLFAVNADDIEPFTTRLRQIEAEFYAQEAAADAGRATLVHYQSVLHANDAWLRP